jgi:carbonic anhydrase/acetyltransferase-like protein (isoleucine patch superfamily)
MALLIEYNGKKPQIGKNVFLAPNATLIGDVIIEDGASIWFGAVLRADENTIIIREGANVQDNCVLHTTTVDPPTTVGINATIGHAVKLEGCIIGTGAVIGMGSCVLNGAQVGEGALIAANSTVLNKQIIPPFHLAAGAPAVVKKELSGFSKNSVEHSAAEYHHLRDLYLAQGVDKL